MDALFPWTIYQDYRWVDVALDIMDNGMLFPVMALRITGAQWYARSVFSRKKWKLNSLWQLPPQDDTPILAVKIGCQRIQYAHYFRYDQIDGIVTDSIKEARDVWRKIGGAGKTRA